MIAIEWDAILPPWLGAALPLGVIITDAALRVRYWSPWLAERSGLAAELACGRPLVEVCPDVTARGLRRHYERALAGEAVTLRQREHGYLLHLPAPQNGAGIDQMQQRAVISPLQVGGEVVGTLTAITDLTERAAQDVLLNWALSQEATEQSRLFAAAERSRAVAEEALQARDAFFSIAAHELRTPLTTLLGRAQLLQKWLAQDGGSQRSLRSAQIVVEQAQRLNRMITALLDVSRLQSGRFTIDHTRVDLAALVRRVADETRPTLTTHALELREPGGPLAVKGDEVRLEQVVQTLLSNAVKYSPGGGRVLVEVAADAGEARLTVRDEGIGVPAAADGKIFRRFYRADNAERHGISGLGVGLFLASEIVELHGGHMGYTSAEGDGSAFTVRLPLDEA